MPRHNEISCVREGCYAIVTLHPDDEARLRRTHETFYCPAGHAMSYGGKTEQEKELDALRRRVKITDGALDEWRARWEQQQRATMALAHGVQVCPLGCGWTTHRRLGWNPSGRDVDRFFDRVGGDLAEHLLGDHNATRKPIALLTERAGEVRG